MVNEQSKWDFVREEGREIIQQWRDKRIKRMADRTSYLLFYLHTFKFETLQSFAQNINLMVLLQMAFAGISVYICQTYNISFDIHVCLFVSPIVFPLAFCIDTDFQRRERVLEDLASFRSSAMVWYFCMRDWKEASELDSGWLCAVQSKVKSILFHLREYLLTSKSEQRKVILCAIYEDFSDVNQLIEKVRASKLPSNAAIISRAIHLLNMMCLAFERLRVVREYRSPRSIRSFNKVFIMFLPIILAPYFVNVGIKSNCKWQPYCIAVIIAFVFSTLQGAQDKLDDPFDGVSEDDINMDTFDELTCSLEHATRRTFAIGRFKVSVEEIISRSSTRPSRTSGFDCNIMFDKSVHRNNSNLKKNSFGRLRTFSNSEVEPIPPVSTPQQRRYLKRGRSISTQNSYTSSLSHSDSYSSYGGHARSGTPGSYTSTPVENTIAGVYRNARSGDRDILVSSRTTDCHLDHLNVNLSQPKAEQSTDMHRELLPMYKSRSNRLYDRAEKACNQVLHIIEEKEIITENDQNNNNSNNGSQMGLYEEDAKMQTDNNSVLSVDTQNLICAKECEGDKCDLCIHTKDPVIEEEEEDETDECEENTHVTLKRKNVKVAVMEQGNSPIRSSTYFQQDSGEDSDHSKDDDDDIESALCEWKQIDAVLRREIFAKKKGKNIKRV